MVTPPDLARARRVLVLINPKAGRTATEADAKALVAALADARLEATLSTDIAEACEKAIEWHLAGELRALIGVGGDGTAAALVNGTPPGLTLGLLPCGTANLLSKHLELPRAPGQLAQIIAAGATRTIDAGVAGGRLFLVMASCGLDADVVGRVHTYRHAHARGGHISYATYLKPIADSIRSYRYPEVRVYCDDQAEPCLAARWVFAFNLPCYGWGLPLAPDAHGEDGLLDLCALRQGSLWHGLRYLLAAQAGGLHRWLPDCHTRRAKRLRLTSDAPVPYQLDGDPGGVLPVDIEVVPGRSTWLVPPDA